MNALEIYQPDSDSTYAERSAVLQKRSCEVLIPLITEAWHIGRLATGQIVKSEIIGVNSSREIGIYLQEWCGREKMPLVFWKFNCEKILPFDFEAANFFMSVARRLDRKAKTLDDVREFAQMVMVSFGQDELPQRAGQQSRSLIPPMQVLACQFINLQKPYQKILQNNPLENWEPDDLRLLISETQWLVDERAKAEKLLSK